MVDIARPSQARKKKIRRILYVSVAVIVVAGISLGVSKLKPAAPTVDRAVVWIDAVKRGSMLRQVRGSGTLVPEDIRWINTAALAGPGRTDRPAPGRAGHPRHRHPRTDATRSSSSRCGRGARLQVGAGRFRQPQGGTAERPPQPGSHDVEHRDAVQAGGARPRRPTRRSTRKSSSRKLTLEQKRGLAADLKNRLAVEQRRLAITREGMTSQLAPQEADVNQRKAAWELRRASSASSRCKAGMSGILQRCRSSAASRSGRAPTSPASRTRAT